MGYSTPAGVVAVRENQPGLADGVLDRPFALDDGSSVELTLYLFHGKRTGWVIVREGYVQALAENRANFEASLRAVLRSMVIERYPTSVLLPGRFVSGNGERVLEVLVEVAGDPADTSGGLTDLATAQAEDQHPGFVLVVAARASKPGSAPPNHLIDMQIVPAADLGGARMVLREPLAETRSPIESAVSREQALPWAASAAAQMGRDAAASLDLLLEVASDCKDHRWLGGAGGVERCLTMESCEDPANGWTFRTIDATGRECIERVPHGSTVAPAAEARVATVADLLLRPVGSAWLVVNPHAGLPLLVDGQAKAILDLLDGSVSVNDIASVATEVFDEDANAIEARIRGLIRILRSAALVTVPPRGCEPQQQSISHTCETADQSDQSIGGYDEH